MGHVHAWGAILRAQFRYSRERTRAVAGYQACYLMR